MKIIKILEKFYESSNIPVGLFDYKNRIAMFPDFGIMPDYTINEYIELKEQGVFYKHVISNAFLHCGIIYAKQDDLFIFVGMVAEHNINTITIRETVNEYGQDRNADISHLIRYFSKTPQMTMSRFEKYLSFLYYLVNEEEPLTNLYDSDEINEDILTTSKETNVYHNSYTIETEMLSLIEYGRTEELKRMISDINLSSANIGITSMDAAKNFKNIFVSSAVLSSRAAIQGGVDYEYALSLTDSYLRKVEHLYKFNEIHTLWVNMLIDFTNYVKKIKKSNAKSRISLRACNYALDNIYSNLSVSEIAKNINVNRSYLSKIFKEDTGKNLTMYLNEIKVDEAKRLLKYTNESLVNISTSLGFSSQNYFQKIFKDFTKQTPLEYREKSKNLNK